ncbi:hypothetical protein AVW11_32185 [Streptomyces amritsarensis]|uniref:Uncharacterized protein n=1 Tax=Streptomyces amritsarensis TaxID=681158 RepID=A0ABX3FW98_9ACTN|nr:hypothetical protein [Streptomyces amritsarensis]OLZ51184.1 hypothetical protein AVW11_32185 [Streptomyces amritsarensis]
MPHRAAPASPDRTDPVGQGGSPFVLKFLNRIGLSPHWLGIHEAMLLTGPEPDPEEVMWHDWVPEPELQRFTERYPFTPDSMEAFSRYARVKAAAGEHPRCRH